MPRQQAVVNDFRGGLNTDVASDHLAANELTTAINIDYSEHGSIRKRNGTEKFNQVSYVEPVTQIFEWHRANGNVELLAVIGNKLCRLDESGNRTIIANLSSGRINYFFLQDKLYFVDGQYYRFYDGEQIQDIKVNNITLRAIPGTEDKGIEPGTYQFVVTYVSTSRLESVASEVKSITITEKSIIVLENLPAPLTNTAYRACYVYREYLGQMQWILFDTISDPSVTTSEYNGWIRR